MSASKSPLEKRIQAEIMAALGAEHDLILFKNSVGQAQYIDQDSGKMWHTPYGLGVGSPDLVGILRSPSGIGVWLAIEVKQPGKEPTEEQLKCHAIWRRFGALVYVAHSVEEAREGLKETRSLLRAMKVSA